jgi:hypothetical protein
VLGEQLNGFDGPYGGPGLNSPWLLAAHLPAKGRAATIRIYRWSGRWDLDGSIDGLTWPPDSTGPEPNFAVGLAAGTGAAPEFRVSGVGAAPTWSTAVSFSQGRWRAAVVRSSGRS